MSSKLISWISPSNFSIGSALARIPVLAIIESGVANEIYNVAGGFEQSNIDTVKKIIDEYFDKKISNYEDFVNFGIERPGQDIRYALNDDKIRSLGWEPKCVFDDEIKDIVEYYKQNFIW